TKPAAYDGQGRKEITMTHDEHEPLAGKRAAVMVGPLFEDAEAIYPYYRLHLPRGVGADLGRDRRGPPRDFGSGDRRRPAKRGRPVGGLGGRRRRQPDLLAPSARSARVHEGADRRGRRGLGARGG